MNDTDSMIDYAASIVKQFVDPWAEDPWHDRDSDGHRSAIAGLRRYVDAYGAVSMHTIGSETTRVLYRNNCRCLLMLESITATRIEFPVVTIRYRQ